MPRQTNFSAGELSPYLWGRTDLPQHAKGARKLRNFFVSREGPAVSRPGTRLVRQSPTTGPVRLIPFVLSDTESYIAEFGTHYLRIHQSGRTQLADNSFAASPTSGTPWHSITDYGDVDAPLAGIQFCQTGTSLLITCPGRPVRELKKQDDGGWYFGYWSILFWQNYFANPATSPVRLTTEPRLVNDGSVFTEDDSHPLRDWEWKVSTTIRFKPTGATVESVASPIANWALSSDSEGAPFPISGTPSGGKVVLYPDKPVTLRRYNTSTVSPYDSIYEVIGYNFYRGRGSLFGFVGTSKTLDFVDYGAEPDYLVQPLLGTAPFAGGLYPELAYSVCFYQQRLVFGGTTKRPTSLIASASGNFTDYDKHTLPTPGQALEFELATRYQERIRWVMPQQQLLVGTDSSVWAVSGTDAAVLDYDSINARVIDNVGATSLQPLTVGSSLLYVRTKGRGVRALSPGASGWEAADISHHATHFFQGGEVSGINGQNKLPSFGHTRQIVDWCYAEDPWGLVWAVRDDGVLLSMTISPNGEIGWAQHETNGFVVAVASVPEGTEDGVYIAVKRKRPGDVRFDDAPVFIERMTSRVENDSAEDDACVDCCIRYKTPQQLTYTGLQHLEGMEVYAVSVGNVPYGPLTVVNGSVTLPELPAPNDVDDSEAPLATVVMFIGLPYQCTLETLDYTPGAEYRTKQKTVRRVGFEVNQSRGLFVGQDVSHLIEWRQRKVADGYAAPSDATEVISVAVAGTYDYAARAVLLQTLPLPVTVLGIDREVDIGG